MDIEKILAVYRASPLLLVVEVEGDTVLELSLTELNEAGYRLSAGAWKHLIEDYQIFTCRPTPRQVS
jgi:hypothetical protein